MLKQQLQTDLKKAVKELGFPSTDIVCDIPKNSQFGDYTTNIALQLSKQNSQNSKQSPLEIANQILEKLKSFDFAQDNFSEIKVAGAGFINFFIKPEFISQIVQEINKLGKKFGRSKLGEDKQVRVEYVSANPTGPLHIGNARGGPLGDVIANVFESQGYQVLREYIHNDVGGQVLQLGKTIMHLIGYPENCKLDDDEEEQRYYQGSYIEELAPKVKQKIFDEVEKQKFQELAVSKCDELAGEYAVSFLFEEIMKDVEQMGIKFDLIVKESELRLKAPEVLEELKSKGVLKEKDGAVWFGPSDEFLKDRETVVIKSNGDYTYFTADIVYHKDKFLSNPHLVIDVFGSNHHGHIPRLKAVVAALDFDPKRLEIVLYQYVRVKRGIDIVRMSKRAGNFITAKEVIDEIGLDAFRFWVLRFSPQTHIDLDLELLKKQSSDNPIYYVQYAHARMVNILNKEPNLFLSQFNPNLLSTNFEQRLIKHLSQFPYLLDELTQSLQVHFLTEYALVLADLFHKFYENCRVLNAEDDDIKKARLALVRACQVVLSNTLSIIGVSAPIKM